MPFRRHGCRIRNLPLFRWLYETPLVDMHAVDRRVAKPQRRDCSGAARKRADDRKRPPHRTGQFDLLGPSTLYALRGIYIGRQADRATEFLSHYARRRLLGDHVPYPIEAWPEGSQRHLAAESGLFCRVITEGLFGIRPTGVQELRSYPFMPSGWNRMALRHIRAFENNFDLVIEKQPDGFLRVTLAISGRNPRAFRLRQGASLRIKLP